MTPTTITKTHPPLNLQYLRITENYTTPRFRSSCITRLSYSSIFFFSLFEEIHENSLLYFWHYSFEYYQVINCCKELRNHIADLLLSADRAFGLWRFRRRLEIHCFNISRILMDDQIERREFCNPGRINRFVSVELLVVWIRVRDGIRIRSGCTFFEIVCASRILIRSCSLVRTLVLVLNEFLVDSLELLTFRDLLVLTFIDNSTIFQNVNVIHIFQEMQCMRGQDSRWIRFIIQQPIDQNTLSHMNINSAITIDKTILKLELMRQNIRQNKRNKPKNIIQKKNICLAIECSRKWNSCSLTTTEIRSFISNLSLIAIGENREIRFETRVANAVLVYRFNIRFPKQNIIANSSIYDPRFLINKCHLSIDIQGRTCSWPRIEFHFSCQTVQQRTLSTANAIEIILQYDWKPNYFQSLNIESEIALLSDDRNHWAFGNRNIDILKNIFVFVYCFSSCFVFRLGFVHFIRGKRDWRTIRKAKRSFIYDKIWKTWFGIIMTTIAQGFSVIVSAHIWFEFFRMLDMKATFEWKECFFSFRSKVPTWKWNQTHFLLSLFRSLSVSF